MQRVTRRTRLRVCPSPNGKKYFQITLLQLEEVELLSSTRTDYFRHHSTNLLGSVSKLGHAIEIGVLVRKVEAGTESYVPACRHNCRRD